MEDKLLELVKCGICLAELQNPLALPCLHSFCETCLQCHVRINAKGKFPCPTCRMQTLLPKNSLRGFTRDFRITEMKEIVHDYLKEGRKKTFKCSICSDKKYAPTMQFCANCRKIYCNLCYERHQQNDVTSEHFTLVLSDQESKLKKCDEHPGESLKFYCHECAIELCISCIIISHSSHHIKLLIDPDNSMYQQNTNAGDYNKWFDHTNTQIEQLQNLMVQIHDREEKLLRCFQETKSQIKVHSQNLIKQVLLNEEQFLTDITSEYKQRLEETTNHKLLCGDALQKFELLQKQMNSTFVSGQKCDYLQEAFEEIEKIQVKKRIEKQIKTFKPFVSFIPVKKLHYGILQKMVDSDRKFSALRNASSQETRGDNDLSYNKKNHPNKMLLLKSQSDPTGLDSNTVESLHFLSNQSLTQPTLVGECSVLGTGPGQLHLPYSICFMDNNQVAVTETGNQRIQVFSIKGEHMKFIEDKKIIPRGICNTPDGNIAVCDEKERQVKIFSKNGELVKCLSLPCPGFPCGLTSTKSNNLVISDMIFECVYVVNSQCNILVKFGCHGDRAEHFDNPSFVTSDNDERIFVSDSCNHSIKVFDSNGKYLFQFGRAGASSESLSYPKGICIDDVGRVFVCDSGNDRIVIFDKNGKFLKVILDANHGLKRPMGLSVRGQFIAVAMPDLHKIQIFKLNSLPITGLLLREQD